MAVEIDGERRMVNARVHSAGHLLDSALFQLGHTDLEPSKVCVCVYVCVFHFMCLPYRDTTFQTDHMLVSYIVINSSFIQQTLVHT